MKIWQKMIIIAIIITVLIVAGTLAYMQYFSRRRLLVSSTTSLDDTGLLRAIESAFEAKYPIDLQFTAVGTGVAIEQGRNGDVDAVLVHAPSQEVTFLQQGFGASRKIIAYNFFTIVGPSSDPAGISGLNSTDALKQIAAYGRNTTRPSGILWVSRGDNSGTHTKEQSLWKAAGFSYATVSNETSWYLSPGGKMGETLLKAEEKSAYTLSDIGTYLAFYEKEHTITLTRFIDERYELLNVYSVIAVNQTRQHHVNINDSITFIRFLISDEGQKLIEDFGKSDYGQSGRLFHNAVGLIKENPPSQMAQWIIKYAFIGNPPSECPTQYRDPHYPDLYS
jgi:tungstate transport system substrate-binding protein